MYKYKYFWLIGSFFFFVPSAFAAVHHYTCGDFDQYVSSSCNALTNVFTIGNQVYNSNSYTTGQLTAGTWYVSFKVSGGSVDMGSYGWAISGEPPAILSGITTDVVEYPITVTTQSEWYPQSAGVTISDWCIDTDGVSCTGTPPPAGPVPFNYATTTTVIDNPVQDTYYGITLFIIGLLIPIWLFKRHD